MKLNLQFVIFLLALTSCHYYKEYDKKSFKNRSWSDDQEIVFEPNITGVDKPFRITLGLRHHYALQVQNIAATIRIISPSGKEKSSEVLIRVRDNSNKALGRCAGDLCDLDTPVFTGVKLEEKGEYKVVIIHNEKGYTIPGILEVGLIIDEEE